MPHSISINRKIKNALQKLNDEIRMLADLRAKRLKNTQEISFLDISLITLKKKYKYKYRELNLVL